MTSPVLPTRRRLVLLSTVLAILVFLQSLIVPVAQAQNSYSQSYSFGVPSTHTVGQAGTINVGVSASSSMSGNFMGCAGIGQFTFILSALNASNLVDQLIQLAETMLAKFVITILFSFPQVQAMMDMLNAIGNLKFQLMQQSCDLNKIRKEGKEMFMSRCMGQNGGNSGDCETQWSNDSSFTKSSIMQQVNQLLCKAEDVTGGMRRSVCPIGGSNCITMGFMPQTRINLGGTGLNCGAKPADYGTHSAPITFVNLFNSHASTVAAPVTLQVNQAYTAAETGTTQAQRENALAAANKRCNTDPLKCGVTSLTLSCSSPVDTSTDDGKTLADFKNHLSCPNPCAMPSFYHMQAYFEELSTATGGKAGTGALGANGLATIDSNLTQASTQMSSQIGSAAGGDASNLGKLSEIATRCSLNKVDYFDPNLHVALLKKGQTYVEANAKAAAVVQSVQVVNSMAGFISTKAKLAASAICTNKAQAQTGTGVAAPNPSNPQMQDSPANKEVCAAAMAGANALLPQWTSGQGALSSAEANYVKSLGPVLNGGASDSY